MNVLKPHKRTTIFTLLGLHKSQRDIERITGIDRKTIRSYQRLYEALQPNSPGVATDPKEQIPPPWPPIGKPIAPALATSKCTPHRAFIDAQLRLGRNAMAIYQDLVDLHGFDGAYNSVKRFVAQLRRKEPEQFDRLSFAPGEEMQVDYGEGAPTRVPGTERWRKPRLFVATLRYCGGFCLPRRSASTVGHGSASVFTVPDDCSSNASAVPSRMPSASSTGPSPGNGPRSCHARAI